MEQKAEKKSRTLPAGETAMFCAQTALILKAGIPLYDGMDTLCDSIVETESKELFTQIAETVSDTGSLYQGVKEVGIFPSYMVHMIHIGEETGKLEDVLRALSIYYQREESVKKSVQSAVLYPMVLILMMSVVIAVLVSKVMPVFDQVFQNLGTEMSASGKAMMNFGVVAGRVTLVLVIILLLGILIVFVLSKTGRGSEKISEISCRLPIFRLLNQKVSAGRFASTLSMMISSGFDIERSLEMAPNIVTDSEAKKKIEACKKYVEEGMSFSEALSKIRIFTPLHERMIRVGFKAGQLDTVMANLADIYEEEVEDSLNKLISFIEPTLVAVLSIVIGGILISVMLPLASIMSSIG